MESNRVTEEFNKLIDTLKIRGLKLADDISPHSIMDSFECALDKEYKKKNGVVYTPTDVAKAMSKIAIDDYLKNSHIRFTTIEETYDKEMLIDIYNSLDDIKICDPCVGSGVYMTEILQRLIEYKSLIVNRLEERILDTKEIEQEAYKIIQNNLYCVDLDYNAILVCKFRLWYLVSDLVDYSEFKCNIWNGNSLDNTYKGEPIFQGTNPSWENGGLNWTLQKYSPDYYEKLKKSYNKWVENGNIRDLMNTIELSINIKYNTGGSERKILIGRNTIKTEGLFDFELMAGSVFKSKGGFDIVIGNPPYVRNTENKDYYKSKYKVANKSGDLYIYFFELAYNIINDNGIVSLITPNKFFSANYAIELRKFLLKKMYKVLDFNNYFVFENAWVTTVVTMLNKKDNVLVKYCDLQEQINKESSTDLYSTIVNSVCTDILNNTLDEEKFVFEENTVLEIKQNLRGMTKLSELYNISKGVAIPIDQRLNSDSKYSIIKGEDLQPYSEKINCKARINEETRNKYYKDAYNQYIAVREISKHIECTMVKGIIPLDSVTIVQSKDYWVVGFLNSDIVDWLYNTLYCKNFMVGYAKVRFPRKTYAIGDIPVPDGIEQITPLVMEIIEGNSVESNKEKINSIIKQLYNLKE